MISVDEILSEIDNNESEPEDIEQIAEEASEEALEENATPGEPEPSGGRKVTPKKPRKPSNRPKLDAERLRGPTGFRRLEEIFANVQYKGKGHESEDLDLVLAKLQYWCHRLFPKFTFDDTLEQLEKLGSKKAVMTLKKKFLLDMMDPEVEPELPNEDNPPHSPNVAQDDFDLLLDQALPVEIQQPNEV